MFMLKNRLKKIVAAAVATLTICLVAITPAKSQGAADIYLALIAQYTAYTAQAAYHIEEYTYGLLVNLNSWMLPDKTETSANLQSSFASATDKVVENSAAHLNMQFRLSQDFLGSDTTPTDLPFANDITFGTLIGKPFFETDPRSQNPKAPKIDASYNYIKNVAGLNLTHVIPNEKDWNGTDDDKKRYKAFYTTISAIQSYSAYVLSQMYVDNANGGALTQQQNKLMQQASSSDWFTKVASENIGVVFRQMLMYNSQLYVLMIQNLQTQKQLLSTLAMTNTLIVIGNQFTENQLISRATGAS